MYNHYIFAGLAGVFAVLAASKLLRNRGQIEPASKTWLLMALIFAAVSGWLFLQKNG